MMTTELVTVDVNAQDLPAVYAIWDGFTWFWLVLRSQGKFTVLNGFHDDSLDDSAIAIAPMLNLARHLFDCRLQVFCIDLHDQLRQAWAEQFQEQYPHGIEDCGETHVLEWLLANKPEVLDAADDQTSEYEEDVHAMR